MTKNTCSHPKEELIGEGRRPRREATMHTSELPLV